MATHTTLKMQAIAVDDEPLALKVIENFCGRLDAVTLQKTFTKPREALDYLAQFPIDLVFLDIQMPGLTGLDFKKLVRPETIVIFTTAYSEFALEGFNVKAMDYLLKPFTFERFKQAIDRALEFFTLSHPTSATQQQYIFLRADYNLHKINLADILWIEGFDDYLKVHQENQKSLVVRMTMKAILEKLPPADFIRVHRSFIVPVARIGRVRNKMVSVAGREIPLGGTYEKAFMDLMGE